MAAAIGSSRIAASAAQLLFLLGSSAVALQLRARVRLSRSRTALIVEVEDDGLGFDPAARVEGLGPRNMRQRAFSAGGWITVDSAPGEGARIRVELPVRAPVAVCRSNVVKDVPFGTIVR